MHENNYHIFRNKENYILFLTEEKQAFTISEKEYNSIYAKKDECSIIEKYIKSIEKYKNNKSYTGKDYIYELYLCVANCCNAKCSYCFAGQGSYGKEKGIMSVETAHKAVDRFMEIVPFDCTAVITYFGGEPLMAYSVIENCCKYITEKYKNRKYEFHITTNATLLDKEMIDFFAENKFKIAVSIDGGAVIQNAQRPLRNGNDSFVEATKFLPYMQEKKLRLLARGTYTNFDVSLAQCYNEILKLGFEEVNIEPDILDKKREYDMDKLLGQLDVLHDYIVDYVKTRNDFPFGLFKMQMRRLFIPLKKELRGCGAGKVTFAVDIKGDMFPCHRHSSMPETAMGNVWEPQQSMSFLDIDYQGANCAFCWNRYTCSHGCMYEDKSISGSYYVKNPYFCKYSKKITEIAISLCSEMDHNRLIRILL